MQLKRTKELLQSLDDYASPEGITDIREAAMASGVSDIDMKLLAQRVGFRFVSEWSINCKVIDL